MKNSFESSEITAPYLRGPTPLCPLVTHTFCIWAQRSGSVINYQKPQRCFERLFVDVLSILGSPNRFFSGFAVKVGKLATIGFRSHSQHEASQHMLHLLSLRAVRAYERLLIQLHFCANSTSAPSSNKTQKENKSAMREATWGAKPAGLHRPLVRSFVCWLVCWSVGSLVPWFFGCLVGWLVG